MRGIKEIILGVVALAVVGCSSPEKKAQKLIKEHLKQTLNDPKNYEPINFEGLDSTFTTIRENSDYSTAYAAFTVYASHTQDKSRYEDFDEHKLKHVVDTEFWQSEIDSLAKYVEILKEMEKEFIPEFKGWSMKHKFRAKNAMNATILNKYIFYFDKDITKIDDYEILDDE